MILVTGATGKVGTALVEQLQVQKTPFRALAHSERNYERLTARGIDTIRGSADDGAGLAAAFGGVERLFLLTPSSPDQAETERAYVDAARQAGVRHIVKQSVLGADDPGVSLFEAHRESERYIRDSGVGYTIVRPNLFMQNLGETDAAPIKQQGAIFNSAGDGVMSFIDARDIAAVAATALSGEEHVGQTYDLTGPEALSYGEVVQKLTALLSHPVRYVPLDDEAFRDALLAAGLSAWYAGGLTDLYRFYREGKGEVVSHAVKRLTGRAAGTMDAYLADARAAFV